jgi:hypothetical protein
MGYKKKSPDKIQDRMAQTLDDLNEFEDFRQKILPKIRQLLREGKKAQDLYKMFETELAARQISLALDPNVEAGKALSAITDAMNRITGKPTEKKEVSHKFEQLPESQLDALLLSELEASNSDDDQDPPEGLPEA